MSKLSVIILCGQSPRHLYFANQVAHACKPLAIIQESGHIDVYMKIIKLLLKPASLWRKLNRWIRDRKRYRGHKEAEFFFANETPQLTHPELRVEVSHINHPDVIQIIDRYQPDLIMVFGTSLLKGELLEKGRLGIINLHGGLSPEYRGADCTFWALYNQEPEKVGCTVHYINAGIDTGNIIAHVSPKIKISDDELTLFWRAVRSSTHVFAELLNRIEQGECFGQIQAHKGHLYQVKDRRFRHEKAVHELLQSGLLVNLNLGKRITWFKL
jgi:folate-dependent phosphoribosylglycinamide formyltransferase PurN